MIIANESFIVTDKRGLEYKVYDITYDKCGYPHFLIFDDNQWLRMSAKHFVPLEDALI